MIQRLGIATYMCYTILESPEQASNTQSRRFLIFVPQLEFSMFLTFDFRCVDIASLHCNGRCSHAVAPRSEQLCNHWLCTDVGFAGKGIKQLGCRGRGRGLSSYFNSCLTRVLPAKHLPFNSPTNHSYDPSPASSLKHLPTCIKYGHFLVYAKGSKRTVSSHTFPGIDVNVAFLHVILSNVFETLFLVSMRSHVMC